MNKKRIHCTLIYTMAIFIFNPWTLSALADEFHEEPYDFIFDNHIDTHQETRLKVQDTLPLGRKTDTFRLIWG